MIYVFQDDTTRKYIPKDLEILKRFDWFIRDARFISVRDDMPPDICPKCYEQMAIIDMTTLERRCDCEKDDTETGI